MAILIATLAMGLLGKVLYNTNYWGPNFRFIALSELSTLLFGPTLFLFTRATLQKLPFTKQNLVHYVPGVAYFVFILVYFIIPTDAIIVQRVKTGELIRVIYTCHAFGLLVNITYWILAWNIFSGFMHHLKHEVSYEIRARFMTNLLLVVGISLGIWLILYATSFLGFERLERDARPYIWIVLTLIILFITYYSMISPQVLQIAPELKKQKYTQSKLSSKDMDVLKDKLDQLMLEKKPHLNSKLLKTELAQMLGVNSPELARLLNENIGMNFFEYVNYYRIQEFIQLAKNDNAKQFTFYGLAQEAGFNSKTTFNKSFKNLIGSSPSEYFESTT
ncbi:AraC family transcriptional regulator [Aquimarina agarilytica]|uniref:AraC family transcriptional regulator n=1 Tax=Aquimarina agarilytica TaxID=1087449 RepID=UPI0018DEE6B8|nr:helix-turn-helix domain-containing protein [Aquimarina agarilytica]